MALGFTNTGSSGDFLPRIQYDAKAGRFFKVDRVQNDAGDWLNDLDDLAMPLRIVLDFETIEVGWIRLDGGVDFTMNKADEGLPPQPSDKHRQGFRALVYNKALGVRHWNHTAKCVIAQIDNLHDDWKAQRAEHRGEVPVVTIDKTLPVTSGSGTKRSTNYAPHMTITEWIKRPEILDKPHGDDNDDVPPPQEAAPSKAKTTEQPAPGQEF